MAQNLFDSKKNHEKTNIKDVILKKVIEKRLKKKKDCEGIEPLKTKVGDLENLVKGYKTEILKIQNENGQKDDDEKKEFTNSLKEITDQVTKLEIEVLTEKKNSKDE